MLKLLQTVDHCVTVVDAHKVKNQEKQNKVSNDVFINLKLL